MTMPSRSCLPLLFFLVSPSAPQAAVPSPAAASTDPARVLRDYRDFAFGREGNAARGRELFQEEQRAACSKCHTVDGQGGKAGPDLYAVGDMFPRRDLIRAVLEPSSDIAVGYGTTLVEMKSGEEYQGILKDSTADQLVLIGADGVKRTLLMAQVKEQRGSPLSLMPEGLQSGLSRQEFADLIEYLTTLKQPDTALRGSRGMPSEILEIAHPVTLRPFVTEAMRFPHHYVQQPGDIRSGLVWFVQIPGQGHRYLAGHQTGKIWLLDKSGGAESKSLFLDIGKEIFNERGPNGLLGMAFHPKFKENHKYYLKHQVFEEGKIATTVVERECAPDFRTDSGRPSRRLWKVVSTTQDHSGGCIGFGPDGFLYIAMGDTGPQQDPQGHGQDLGTHLAKILRIDVDHRDPGLEYENRPGQ